jgi:hypothetical protein
MSIRMRGIDVDLFMENSKDEADLEAPVNAARDYDR